MLKANSRGSRRRQFWKLLVLIPVWWLVGCCSTSSLVKGNDTRMATSGVGQVTPVVRRAVATTAGADTSGLEPSQKATATDRPCDPYSAPNSCYQTSSTCNLVVLTCQRCCYDQNGNAKGPSSCVCGACFGVSFP